MMENMLQAVIVVFMLFLCALCLFAVVVIARDIVHESAKARRERDKEEREERLSAMEKQLAAQVNEKVSNTYAIQETPLSTVGAPVAEAPVVYQNPPQAAPIQVNVLQNPVPTPIPASLEEVPASAPAEVNNDEEASKAALSESEAAMNTEIAVTDVSLEETLPSPEDAEEDVEDEEDPDEVSFNRLNLSVEEKYATLSTEFKRYFDDIVRHAVSKEGVKEFKRSSSYDYKIGAYKVLRITIKRGEIVCSFNFIDRNFNDYANESNVKIKQSATVVRVYEASGVGVVKDGIDLVCVQIAEDKEHKKEIARAKRRERRRLQKESATLEE